MKNYKPLEINNCKELSKIIKNKNYGNKHIPCDKEKCNKNDSLCLKKILEINEPLINKRYNIYSRSLSSYPFKEFEKKAFKSLYTNLTKNSRNIINKIKDLFPATCPYCGIDNGSTIEHILPKDIFSEYSIFSKNLIPCCSTCNSLKGIKIRELNKEYSFINFYESEAPEEEFLKVKIVDIKNNLPIFKYSISEKAPGVFKNHFKNLNLIKRYQNNSNDIATEIVRELERIKYSFTKNKTKKFLSDKYEDLKNQYGYNYWKALIYLSVAQSENYLNVLYGIYRNVEDINDIYNLNLTQNIEINCKVTQDSFRETSINNLPYLKIGASLKFNIEYKAPLDFDKIFWKVKNSGKEAEKKDNIRGQIIEGNKEKTEVIKYKGKHFVECYLIKGKDCIARKKLDIKV